MKRRMLMNLSRRSTAQVLLQQKPTLIFHKLMKSVSCASIGDHKKYFWNTFSEGEDYHESTSRSQDRGSRCLYEEAHVDEFIKKKYSASTASAETDIDIS
mmetsp:Transcript_10958/g.14471  ORF Transcript_10958/g.14471 Transcript_10958/m.14471 type:complete len:100 (+) Transcript_10958:130-429(+)